MSATNQENVIFSWCRLPSARLDPTIQTQVIDITLYTVHCVVGCVGAQIGGSQWPHGANTLLKIPNSGSSTATSSIWSTRQEMTHKNK